MKKLLLIFLFSITACFSIQAISAVDMYLKIDDIEGESVDEAHQGEIDVLSWSSRFSSAVKLNQGGRSAAAGRVLTGELIITKYVDSTSPGFSSNCCNGKHYGDSVLTVVKAAETLEYVVISMKNLIITSYSTNSPSADDDRLTETIIFNYESYKMHYQPQIVDSTARSDIETGFKVGR